MQKAIIIKTKRACRWLVLVVVILTLLVPIILPDGIFAAGGQPGVSVTPINLRISLDKGEMSKAANITVRNGYDRTVKFKADLKGMQLSANASLAPSEAAEPTVASSLSVVPSELTLAPGQSADVHVTLTNSAGLSPGGHYASVLIRQVNDAGGGLSLSPAVSVAVFIVKEDGAIRNVSVGAVNVGGSVFSVPQDIRAVFVGGGNVGVVPRASVNVHDPVGRLVASGALNEESITVFPGKQIIVQAKLAAQGFGWVPGRYKVQVIYRYDGVDAQQTATSYKLIIPLPFIAALITALAILAAAGRVTWIVMESWRARRSRAKAEALPRRYAKSFDIVVNGSAHQNKTVRNYKPKV